MYYLVMKTALKADLKAKTFCTTTSHFPLIQKEISLIKFKFYQKLFVFLISFSTILIFPESPRELEDVCEYYNPTEICNVW